MVIVDIELSLSSYIYRYLSIKTNRQNYLSVRKTVKTLVVEEIYHVLIFPCAELCKNNL